MRIFHFLLLTLVLSSCRRHYYTDPCPEVYQEAYQENGTAYQANDGPTPSDPENDKEYMAMAFRASDGLCQYENESYSHLQTVNGSLDLFNMLVTQFVMTDEKLAAECSDIGGVNVGGKAWVKKSIIRGPSHFHDSARFYDSQVRANITICGNLYACGTHFGGNIKVDGDVNLEQSCLQGCLTAKAEMIDLHSTSTKSIIIEPSGPYYDPQVVRLSNGSVVEGDLHFKSGKGKVCIDNSSCLRGNVYGGHVMSHHYWQDH